MPAPRSLRAACGTDSWVAQVALSLFLLVAAGLLLRSLGQGQSTDPGFDPEGVLLASLDVQSRGFNNREGALFYQQLVERLRTLPGVTDATVSTRVPLGFLGLNTWTVAVEGYDPATNENMSTMFNVIGPHYLQTLRINLLDGRELDHDNFGGKELLVNRTMADRYWSAGRALGGRMLLGAEWYDVVGIVEDGKYQSLSEGTQPHFFLSFSDRYEDLATLQVRTSGDPLALLEAVRHSAQTLDPDLALFDAVRMADHIKAALFAQTVGVKFLAVFGTVALLLAGTGLYGVMAHSVAQRQREIGLRVALGAEPHNVLGMVVRQGLLLCALGLAIGWLGALAGSRLLAGLLLGVSATDPIVFWGVTAVLLAVGLFACAVPGLRACRLDPVVALRQS